MNIQRLLDFKLERGLEAVPARWKNNLHNIKLGSLPSFLSDLKCGNSCH